MSIIGHIRALQAGISGLDNVMPPEHAPEMLLIGCVDARLNITNDVGIPYGKALIYRNVAALISGTRSDNDPEHVGEAAVIEFSINVMKVKDIVVMGHTDCGGIRACLQGVSGARHIMQYLEPLNGVRDEVMAQGGNSSHLARAMEQAAVRQSIANLSSYNAVAEALANKKLTLHGWVINTATKHISEMDIETGEFKLMV